MELVGEQDMEADMHPVVSQYARDRVLHNPATRPGRAQSALSKEFTFVVFVAVFVKALEI